MSNNTAATPSSSPPSFIRDSVEAEDRKKEAAARAANREAEAQITDEMEARHATMVKATNRLIEMADYLSKIDAAVGKVQAEFIAQLPIGIVADTQVAFESAVEKALAELKKIGERVSTAREELLPARLDKDETRTFTAQSGVRLTRTTAVRAGIRAGMKDDAFDWLRKPIMWELPTVEEQAIIEKITAALAAGEDPEHEMPVRRPAAPWIVLSDGTIGLPEGLEDGDRPDYGSLITETVNASSLSSLAKELLELGKALPEDVFNVFSKDGVSITNPNKPKKSGRKG